MESRAQKTMGPASSGRLVVSLVGLAALAGLAWGTMEPGKPQQLTWILLGFFALRVVLGWLRARKMEAGPAVEAQGQKDVEG